MTHGAAWVLNVDQMIERGLLGPLAVSAEYLERLGRVMVLPYPGHSVYWDKPPYFGYGDISNHGGVSPQEMEIPIMMLSLGQD